MRLFYALDIFRREQRFHYFLLASDAIALSLQKKFDVEWLKMGAQIAKSIDVQILIKQGLNGNELAVALLEKRREKLAEWL